jgi:hypothetical protein
VKLDIAQIRFVLGLNYLLGTQFKADESNITKIEKVENRSLSLSLLRDM